MNENWREILDENYSTWSDAACKARSLAMHKKKPVKIVTESRNPPTFALYVHAEQLTPEQQQEQWEEALFDGARELSEMDAFDARCEPDPNYNDD